MKPSTWHWANAEGKPVPVTLTDLRSSLRKGTIPAHVWVWQTGWRHWLPAYRVEELAEALGSRAREPQPPTLDPSQQQPPKLPKRPKVDLDAPRLSTPVPPAPRNQPLARRSAAPTISNEAGYPKTTLRPPGAVPPPPRGIPRVVLPELESAEPSLSGPPAAVSSPPALQRPAATSQAASSPIASAAAVVATLSPQSKETREAELDVPDAEISATSHNAPDSELAIDPDASQSPLGNARHPAADAKGEGFGKRRFRQGSAVVLIIALTSLGTGTWLVFRPTSTPKPQQPTLQAPEKKPFSCGIAVPAERVSPRVSMTVNPIALDSPLSRKVALGFAESGNTAAGILIDPINLSVQFPYRETQAPKIVSVTPKLLGQNLSYVSVREAIALKQARAVADSHEFLFGVLPTGFARQLSGQPAETIWPLEPNTAVTDPRLATNPGRGHAVTFRKSGQTGTIELGFLTPDGASRSAPTAIEAGVKLLGTPSLAVSTTPPHNLVIAFAGRDNESAPWSLHLSAAPWGKPHLHSRRFLPPRGGPGGDAISPSLASLPDGRWLLQWSEGPAGARVVRVQLLNPELQPLLEAHTVSPAGQNSGQGLLWAAGDRAVSFYVVSTGKQAELWATSLSCSQ